ncbi:hypothetical protein TNIN_127181 [Trichonephila inaurata madagascariensis]|uniref:Uncharacterized protein n=1 Tax=Trichonephila inaurata madagascariensis TaxID=2747483 RepID=A0A8X6WXF3_9ARAC|nr:hypothetical protein TNIN_127181 [Trichonephila inaurata madagascariensis]
MWAAASGGQFQKPLVEMWLSRHEHRVEPMSLFIVVMLNKPDLEESSRSSQQIPKSLEPLPTAMIYAFLFDKNQRIVAFCFMEMDLDKFHLDNLIIFCCGKKKAAMKLS